MIIETTANQFYRVRESDMAHVWLGVRVKLAKGAFVDCAKAREELVRKAGCRTVASIEPVEILGTLCAA